MLLNNFFSIVASTTTGQGIEAGIRIHQSHPIFNGHFPGQPVVPGVCMMQMIKEITEHALHQKFFISDVDHMKFLVVINPLEHQYLQARIQVEDENNNKKISATIFAGSVTFFKFKAIFQHH